MYINFYRRNIFMKFARDAFSYFFLIDFILFTNYFCFALYLDSRTRQYLIAR